MLVTWDFVLECKGRFYWAYYYEVAYVYIFSMQDEDILSILMPSVIFFSLLGNL